MQAELLFACILHLASGGAPDGICKNAEAVEIATAARTVSAQFDLPVTEFVATGFYESGFRKHARSSCGAIGYWQVLRHGAIQGAFLRFTDAQLEDVNTNAWIAASYMAAMKRQCPQHYLSRYNGNRAGCVASRYERAIKALTPKIGRSGPRS